MDHDRPRARRPASPRVRPRGQGDHTSSRRPCGTFATPRRDPV